jgi:hypothetical protein
MKSWHLPWSDPQEPGQVIRYMILQLVFMERERHAMIINRLRYEWTFDVNVGVDLWMNDESNTPESRLGSLRGKLINGKNIILSNN